MLTLNTALPMVFGQWLGGNVKDFVNGWISLGKLAVKPHCSLC